MTLFTNGARAAHPVCADCIHRDTGCSGQLADRSGRKCSGHDTGKAYPAFDLLEHDAEGDERVYFLGIVADQLPSALSNWGFRSEEGDKAEVVLGTLLFKARCTHMIGRAEYDRLRAVDPEPLPPGASLDI